jgi:glycosyltransferase involved in cell wall biosynthesis
MLAHYVDPRCHAVLFRTDHARRAALRFIEDAGLLDERARADFAAKLHVVRPALPFRPGRALARPTRVLCSGRSFQDKGGTVALAVFRELHARLGALVELVLIGNVPLGLVAARPGFEILPVLPRDTYLRVLGDAHVFFSPTLFESFGMALLEAASRGLAIVTSSGDGMEHIDELFTDGQSAVLVPNGLPFDEQVRRYVDAIASLVNAPERLRALRDATGRLVESGALSIGRRDQLLLERYAAVEEAGRRVPESRWSDPTAALAAEHHLTRRDFSEEYLFLEIAARAPDRHFRIRIQDPG